MHSAQSLEDVSKRYWDTTLTVGLALMKGNYTEAASPIGRVLGVRPRERDLAIQLRESLRHRFGALGFHLELIAKVHDGYQDAIARAGPTAHVDYNTLRWAGLRQQALFDSVVFQAVSLFDYLGNAIWYGFHGPNFLTKKWKRAKQAAADPAFEERLTNGKVRIHGSETGGRILDAHSKFVGQLADYRAGLFHVRADSANARVSHSFETIPGAGGRANWKSDLEVFLPKDYSRRVRRLVHRDGGSDETLLLVGAERLICEVGDTAVALLEALIGDCGWAEGEALSLIS